MLLNFIEMESNPSVLLQLPSRARLHAPQAHAASGRGLARPAPRHAVHTQTCSRTHHQGRPVLSASVCFAHEECAGHPVLPKVHPRRGIPGRRI